MTSSCSPSFLSVFCSVCVVCWRREGGRVYVQNVLCVQIQKRPRVNVHERFSDRIFASLSLLRKIAHLHVRSLHEVDVRVWPSVKTWSGLALHGEVGGGVVEHDLRHELRVTHR